jgi:WD40-like Beta Propeller Repeat
MRQAGKDSTSKAVAHMLRRGAGLLIVAMVASGLFSVASASANFETVKVFAGSTAAPEEPTPGHPVWPEEVQLGGVGGMAINRTGAGGVAPGTLYAATDPASAPGGYPWRIARYGPNGDFELAWDGLSRCGPKANEPAHESCAPVPSDGVTADVAIDQTTGNVYVLYQPPTGANSVVEYSPDGSKLLAQFAPRAPFGSTTTETPDELHGGVPGIVVDGTGKVYVYDIDNPSDFYSRLAIFQPQSPGDYEHYVYAGEVFGRALGTGNGLSSPVLDDSGHIFFAGDDFVEEYDLSQPSTPLCTFKLNAGGIVSMTVNQETGEPFYYSYKNELIHQLACNGAGKFVEVAAFKAVPQRSGISAMVFNPDRQYDPSRRAGVLYAGAPSYIPGAKPAQSALGYILAPPVEVLPEVVSEAVSQVGNTTATLGAQINPKGSQTSYVFQYIPQEAWEANEPGDRFTGAVEAPVGGAALGSGQEAVGAAVALTGLVPGGEYHYRVIATSHCSGAEPEKVCDDSGEDQAFRTFGIEAPGLPDARAWEMVSPVQKNGGEVLPLEPGLASCGSECKPGPAAHRFAIQVAPGGEGIAYQGAPFSFNEGPSEFDEYVSRRGASGWQTTSLGPPLAGNGGSGGFEVFGLSHDLSSAVAWAKNPALTAEAPSGYRNLFAEQTSDRFHLDPLVRQTPPSRTPEGFQGWQIEYVGGTPDLSRAFFTANDALTEETPFAPAAADGGVKKNNLYEWSGGQLRLVNVQPGNAETIPGAVLGSGLQLAVAASPAADFSNAISADGSRVFWSSEGGQVYVRENGEVTREIPDHTGKFLSASTDGSKLLLSDGVLYDLETETSTDLTEGKGGFEGLSGQSDDLSSLYFVDTEVLDETPNETGADAKVGKPNLYAWHEGAVSFVATLLPFDNSSGLGTWMASPVQRRAEASPDGRWLAFNSRAEATGRPSIGACDYDPNTLEYTGSVPCEEVFLYDSRTGKLTCASCNPVGEHPHGGSFLRLAFLAGGYLSQPRYLTNQGRLFFDSRDSLSVNDTNGKVEDVYEFKPEGVGSCTKEGGCVSLISAGHEAVDSNFYAMDEDGKDVFFTSRDRLVLKDKDDMIDLYDAREGGGFPSETEVARTECQGEACQPQVSAPNDPTPGSSTFAGAGNLHEEGKAKKHHKKKQRHAKKKKHAKKHKRSHARAAKHNRGGIK